MDFSAGLATFGAIKEMAGLLVNERDRQKLASLQIDLSEKIVEAHARFSELLGTVIEQQRLIQTLQQQVSDMAAAKAEQERYVLAELGGSRKFFAYRLRSPAELGERADEAPHFVCQPCFEAGKKIVLNDDGRGRIWCPVCKHGVGAAAAAALIPAEPPRRRDGFFRY